MAHMSMDDDDGAVSYADHDVQHILHGFTWLSNADSGPSDSLTNTQQFEITERGLEPDEIAELRAMRVTVATSQDTTVNQGLPGNVVGLIGAGYNLSGEEFLQANPDETAIDNDNSGQSDFIASTKDTDEVGQLYTAKVQESVNFGSNSNSVGGGANDTALVETINFSELFGSGPFVDSADDFTSRLRLEVNDVLETVEIQVMYSLYYNVMETEGGRSRFGR